MKGQTFIWTSQEVVKVIDRALQVEDFNQSAMLKYLYCPAIWTTSYATNYGHFAQTERFQVYWHHCSPEHLPEEFRLSLLIMGVSL